MRQLLGSIAIVGGIVLGTLSVTGWGRAETKLPPNFRQILTPIGHEKPADSATLNLHGWNIADAPSCPVLITFRNLQTYLGPPIGPFTGTGQDYLFGRIVCVPTNGPGYQAIPDDLGRQLLLLRGLTEQPNAEPDPVVHRWILEASQTGFEPRQIAGRVISPVLYTSETPKTCTQYTDKAVISWTPGAGAVGRAEPVGCLLNQSCYRLLTEQAMHWQSRSVSVLLLIVAVLLFGSGIGIAVLRGRDAGHVPSIA